MDCSSILVTKQALIVTSWYPRYLVGTSYQLGMQTRVDATATTLFANKFRAAVVLSRMS